MSELRLRDTDVHWREMDGEVVALEARSSTYVATNSSGTLLWRALAAGATREGLADELVRVYGIGPEQARTDADHFLEAVDRQGLLAR